MSLDPRRDNDSARPIVSPSTSDRPGFGQIATNESQDPVDRVLARLDHVCRTGQGWSARCPFHDDQRNSLNVGRGQHDQALVHCHTGCAIEDVLAAIGLTTKDLFPPSDRKGPASRIVEEYPYHDEGGELLYVVVRRDPKDFRCKRPDGMGGWIWGMTGVRRVLYRLPELLAADPVRPVFIPEGEKDVDTLTRHGLVATTNPHGAPKWKDRYSAYLAGRDVVVLPDNDDLGRQHAQQVATSVAAVARSVRILELPDLPAKGDVTDWLAMGGTPDLLTQLAQAAPVMPPPGKPPTPGPGGPAAPAAPSGPAPSGPGVPPVSPGGGVGTSVAGWPDPLHADALHGLAGRFVREVAPLSEADPAAILMQFLATVGCMVGDAVHAFAGDTEHPARINVLTVGPTGRGRKDTAGRPSRRLVIRADPSFKSRMVEGLSSGEGLIYAVRDPSSAPASGGGGRPAIADPGVEDKRLLVLESEFAQTLWVSRRSGNVLSPVIRKAWESGDLRTLTKNNPVVATGAHIVITGNITREELLGSLSRTDIPSGLANRFLLCAARRVRLLPDGGGVPDAVLDAMADDLAGVRAWALVRRRLLRDPDASAIWHGVYPRLTEGEPGLYGLATNRAEAQVLRLSVLYAILDRSEVIQAVHLRAALAVWNYAAASARWVFGDTPADPVATTILAALRARPMSRTDISCRRSRYSLARSSRNSPVGSVVIPSAFRLLPLVARVG